MNKILENKFIEFVKINLSKYDYESYNKLIFKSMKEFKETYENIINDSNLDELAKIMYLSNYESFCVHFTISKHFYNAGKNVACDIFVEKIIKELSTLIKHIHKDFKMFKIQKFAMDLINGKNEFNNFKIKNEFSDLVKYYSNLINSCKLKKSDFNRILKSHLN